MSRITVSALKFKEMDELISCTTIAERSYAKGWVEINNTPYVIIGSMGSGTGPNDNYWGHKIVYLKFYTGNKKPLRYNEHRIEVDQNKRERGYDGMIVDCNGIECVMVGEQVTFTCEAEQKQLNLFTT